MIYGDYHTHTKYSHGKDGVEDNVRAAIAAGLREIAITDHGFRHIFHSFSRKKYDKMKNEIQELKEKYPDISILLGVESNMTGKNGTIDLTKEQKNLFDIILCGYHVAVWGDMVFFAGNQLSHILFGFNKRQIDTNTKAYIKMIQKNPVAILTHINLRIKADVVEVAKAARDCGTFIEISGKRTGCTDTEIEAMAATGVKFVLNSDGHSADKIGDIKLALDIVDRVGIPYEQIANWGKRPEFRRD